MFRFSPIFFIFCVGFIPGFSQQNIVLKGNVLDKSTGEPVSFAHVGICGTPIGAISDENGVFQLSLVPYLSKDTLCVSSIGYETYQESISVLREMKNIKIELNPQTVYLNELVVAEGKVTARRVLEKAIDRISKNYPVKPFILNGFYRDYMKKNNEVISLLESDLSVQDPGFNKPDTKTRVRINRLTFNPGYADNFSKYCNKDKEDTIKEIMEGFSPFVNENEFTNMLSNNPIRNHSVDIPILGLFDRFYLSNLKLELAGYKEIGGREVYVIKFEPNEMFKYHYIQVFGEIYVRLDDYAIVKFNYNYYLSLTREKKKLYELTVEYRETQGKMFLNYLSFANYFKIYTGDEIAELYLYREFFVTDINYGKFEPVKDKEAIDNRIPFHMYNSAVDPQFWNNYGHEDLNLKPLKN
jgi:hypothetical protein